MRIILDDARASLTRSEDGKLLISLSENGMKITAELTDEQVRALCLEGISLAPIIAPVRIPDGRNGCYRILLDRLVHLDDRTFQMLLREIYSDDLIRILWFSKNRELITKTMTNMSQRAAVMLTEDLEQFIRKHKDADSSSVRQTILDGARESVLKITEIARQLDPDTMLLEPNADEQ